MVFNGNVPGRGPNAYYGWRTGCRHVAHRRNDEDHRRNLAMTSGAALRRPGSTTTFARIWRGAAHEAEAIRASAGRISRLWAGVEVGAGVGTSFAGAVERSSPWSQYGYASRR